MFKTAPSFETRVVSLNTDSIAMQIEPGDEDRVEKVIASWEDTFGFQMERTEVLSHRGLNINSYIEVVREGGGEPFIKSKGSLAHDPGISADHNAIIISQAIGQWMLDGTAPKQFIQEAADRREILAFTEMRSAPSSHLRFGGQSIGRLARVYRSTRIDLPVLTKDATGDASEQTLESGFAYLADIHWPEQNDVDIVWYVQQANLILAQTSTPYSPHHNKLAQQLQALGLTVLGIGGAATVLTDGQINEQAVAKGTEKNPRNFSGDRALAISLTKSSGVLSIPPGHADESSLVLRFGNELSDFGEIHDRERIGNVKLRELRNSGVDIQEKGWVKVYEPSEGLNTLTPGTAAQLVVKEVTPKLPPSQSTNDPVTNDDFLEVMFGHSIDDAFVCSNSTPPDTEDENARIGMWAGGPIENSRNLYQASSRQNYTCVSTFRRTEEDYYYRQIEYFNALHFIVLDDIGTKVTVDPRTLGFGEPTYINETSPGNHQWFYRLSEPVRDISVASYLTKQVLAMPVQGHLMTDQGAKGVTRLCKLPEGMNLKLSLGTPWQNQQVSWRPDLSYSAAEIAGWFGANLNKAPIVHAAPAASSDDAESHPLIVALEAAGMLKSGHQKGSGWWDIHCHQRDLHTKSLDNGTAVKVRGDGSWTYKCQHGHCADTTPRDLYNWLSSQGYKLTPPQHRPNVVRIDRARLQFSEGDEDSEGGGGGVGAIGHTSGSGGGRPTIYIDPGLLPQILQQCADLLDDVVFKRGPYLVRIGTSAEVIDGSMKLSMQPNVTPASRYWLLRELTVRAEFKRFDKRSNDYKVIDCPLNIAVSLELGTSDVTFQPLTAIANTPFLRNDGTVCDTLGYDVETGIYYAPTLNFPPVIANPTWQDAKDALGELSELVSQFPFANPQSRSVFLADVLTALARPTLRTSPMVLYTATMAGTGKTLMASIANLIAYGYATTHPWTGNNEEELKKVFTSILIAGDPVVVFDNLPNGGQIKHPALSQFVTSENYADRKLGESERVKFRNRTRVVLTGNNVTLTSDNARRTIVCDLELKVASLKDRQINFDHPSLATYIRENRSRLVVAGLTVLKAYAVQPAPLMMPPLESFEDWSWRVRDALVWLGEEDPVAAVDYGNDGSDEIAGAFEAMAVVATAKVHGDKLEFRASDLALWASSSFALREALELAGCTDPVSSPKVSYWLRALKNRIAGDYKLTFRKVHGGREAGKWMLEIAELDVQK